MIEWLNNWMALWRESSPFKNHLFLDSTVSPFSESKPDSKFNSSRIQPFPFPVFISNWVNNFSLRNGTLINVNLLLNYSLSILCAGINVLMSSFKPFLIGNYLQFRWKAKFDLLWIMEIQYFTTVMNTHTLEHINTKKLHELLKPRKLVNQPFALT